MLIALALLACRSPVEADTEADTETPPADTGPKGPASADWCERMTAGPADGKSVLVGLSAAHAGVRLFGPDPDFATADAALASALRSGTLEAPDLDAYALGVASACALDVGDGILGAATVDLRGDVAWVTPGVGAVALPEGTKGVVLDLRGLPDAEGLEEALAAAVGAAIATSVQRPDREVHRWTGWVDQVFSATNVYEFRRTQLEGGDWEPAGAVNLPLAVVTGRRMAPAAAELAGSLAEEGRAIVVGNDVLASVAEARFTAVGDRGLAWRGLLLLAPDDSSPWPDVLPADVPTDDPEAALAGDPTRWPAWTGLRSGSVDRPQPISRDPFGEDVVTDADAAALQAGLIAVHGTLRAFYPYFDVVGDTIDERLVEVLADPIDAADRVAYVRRLGRLGEALHDGHVFFGDYSGAAAAGYLPAYLDILGGVPVVARSTDPDLQPGDSIVEVDGQPIAGLIADQLTWHGAATAGYAEDLATRWMYRLDGPTEYGLVDPDGVARIVTIAPSAEPYPAGTVAHPRPNGTLDDLGAPDIAYLNMDAATTTTTTQVKTLISAQEGVAAGLVVDMRGYPGIDHYDTAKRLIQGPFQSPSFAIDQLQGPDVAGTDFDQYDFTGVSAGFTGPIVLIVGPSSVSAAENFSMMLVGAGRVTVVGRQSAGTNGNITGLALPGGYYFTFTGMQVLFPDGSTFHGSGVVPDIPVAPTAADYRDGRDPELEAAIAQLRGM